MKLQECWRGETDDLERKREEGGKESGRWSRVREPDGEPGMGTCHSSDKMIEHT